VSFPSRAICPGCRGTEFEKTALTREGKVVTSTVLYVAPNEFAMETPYAAAIVETPEGARLMVHLIDCEPDAVKPGLPVALEFRLIRQEGHGGILCYGHKAVPAGA